MSTTSSSFTLSNGAIPQTLQDSLLDLGGITADRILPSPPMGQATIEDMVRINQSGNHLCELVDGTLVEKAMSFESSIVAIAIATLLRNVVSSRKLGVVSGSDGFFQLQSTARGPDVAFVHRDRLAGGRIPKEPIPCLAPNLAVEVLSPSNARSEMTRKRLEYFHAGVPVGLDCRLRS